EGQFGVLRSRLHQQQPAKGWKVPAIESAGQSARPEAGFSFGLLRRTGFRALEPRGPRAATRRRAGGTVAARGCAPLRGNGVLPAGRFALLPGGFTGGAGL